MPLAPFAQLFTQVLNLFPQKPGGTITTPRFNLDDRCGYLDHARVEINRAAGGELERAACPRNHLATNEVLRRSENFFGQPANIINHEDELGFQANDGARRRKMNP